MQQLAKKIAYNILNVNDGLYNPFIKLGLLSKKEFMLYNKLGCPKPFDVTLRDGLQSLSKEQQQIYTLEKKKKLYEKINLIYQPKSIEFGSIVSKNILPIFSDTLELFNYIENNDYNSDNDNKDNNGCSTKNYILIPSREKLLKVINIPNLNNFSFITSVSDVFQKKNTKKSLYDNDNELNCMIDLLDNSQKKNNFNIKLYVSCINECPISGKIHNDIIVGRILKLNELNVNDICLSDTCGTLDVVDFEYIVDMCYIKGVPFSKLSLHLHVSANRENIVEQIFFAALNRGIINFDVSLLDTGGCSVTMNKEKIAPNLSYDLYYKFLKKYIQNNTI
jgi:isopropylmalate/homocitrate/citramalate synthase